jgi:hypothetical protein
MRAVAPRVADWVERMLKGEPPAGRILPDDALPATLERLLARLFRELGAVIESTIERLASFEPNSPEAALPRAIGRHRFEIGGVAGERAIVPFDVWRWQRAHDHYGALASADRARTDALLERTGGRAALQRPIPRRVERRSNRLFLAPRCPAAPAAHRTIRPRAGASSCASRRCSRATTPTRIPIPTLAGIRKRRC